MMKLATVACITLISAALPKTASASPDYCQYGEGTVLFLVDRTTQYDQYDMEVLVAALDPIITGLATGDRLVVQTIAGDFTETERVFDQCVPGCPEGGGIGSWLTGSCSAMIAKKQGLQFKATLAKKLVTMLKELRSYEHSDIARTVAEVTRTYGGDDLKRLILFSDMLENSRMLPFSRFSRGDAGRMVEFMNEKGLVPNVGDAEVDVFGFGRSHNDDRKPLPRDMELRIAQIWKKTFQAGGAQDITIGLNYVDR